MTASRSTIVAILLLVGTVGCSSSSTPPPPPAATQHLYVTDHGNPGSVFVFNLPVTAASTPAVTLLTTGNTAGNPCFDTTHIYVPMGGSDTVQVFALPLTATSVPAFTLTTTGGGVDCHFDQAGNLYVSEAFSGIIEIFKAPVVSGSTVFATLTAAFIGGVPAGISTDTSGDLFIAATGHAGVELSPYPANTLLATFGPGTSDAFGITIGPSGSAYIANATAGGVIDVYDPPFSNASAKNAAKTITTSLTAYVSFMSFDSGANLYAGGAVGAVSHVLVYAPPYTGVPIDLNRGATLVWGVAIGP